MDTSRKLVLAAVAFAALAVACGKAHDRSLDIVATNPTGTFNSEPWAMTKATVKLSGADGGNPSLSVKLFGTDVADCATSAPDAGYIMWSMPGKVGKRSLKLSLDFTDPDNQTITFYTPPSNNTVATDGILNVTALDSTSVTIGVLAKAGTKMEVNGTFTANLCP